ncbi:hypothetical protein [Kitasatospora sp. NPDC002040]|uniref:hypothetical protein n=1 Tax=Kitasatospora sp. NPDC002040 TaxID=3154661 RepID=UPI00332E97BB
MSQINRGWTSDHLLKPNGTSLYADQQRERLRQMANEALGLLHEYQASLGEIRIDGDKPWDRKSRAKRAAKPMASLEKHLRQAVTDAERIHTEYTRLYVELPLKRAERAKAKELKKAAKSSVRGGQEQQAMNTASALHGIGQGVYVDQKGNASGNPEKKESVTFLDFLEKGA